MPLPFTVRRTDSDAAAFCARSGASDRAAVSAFVRGVKDLGLWESMVCWPLRSTQNAGTGTTAYSLGGLGTYNGTLANGPVWGVDGVTFGAGTARAINISPPLTSNRSNHTAMAFAELNDTLSNYRLMPENDTSSFHTDLGVLGVQGVFEWRFSDPLAPAAGPSTAGWHTFAAVKNGSLLTGHIDGTSETSTPSTSTDINIGIGGNGNIQATWNGKIALALFSNAHMTTASVQAIRSLYKSTLGTGLGLP